MRFRTRSHPVAPMPCTQLFRRLFRPICVSCALTVIAFCAFPALGRLHVFLVKKHVIPFAYLFFEKLRCPCLVHPACHINASKYKPTARLEWPSSNAGMKKRMQKDTTWRKSQQSTERHQKAPRTTGSQLRNAGALGRRYEPVES